MSIFRYLHPDTCHSALVAGLVVAALGAGCGGEDAGTPAPEAGDRVSEAMPTPKTPPASSPMLPPPADPRFELGRQLLVSGRYPEAEVVFESLAAEGPRHPSVAFLLAVAIQKQKRYAVALERLDELDGLSVDYPERSQLDHFRGWCLFYLGRPSDAADAFSAHLLVRPDEPDSHFGRGVSLLELGEPEAALASFDRAIEIDLGDPDRRRDLGKAWIRRGDALWELERLEEATASFHKGVIQFADHYEGWAKLARGHERLGDESKVDWARREERNARRRVGAPIDGETAPGDGVEDAPDRGA